VMQELARACDELERKSDEAERMWHQSEVTSLDASNLEIELVAREARIDQLVNDIQALKQERRGLEVRERDLAAESRSLNDSLSLREHRLENAEEKLARLMSELTSTQERL